MRELVLEGRHLAAFDLLDQLALIPQFVSACGFANAKAAGYEADDFLAAAVAAEERRRKKVVVASGDRDTFQLASKYTTITFPVRAGEVARIGPDEVVARYGQPWTRARCCLHFAVNDRLGGRRQRLHASGGWQTWQNGWINSALRVASI